MITIQLNSILALLPAAVLLISIGVATASIKYQFKRHEEKLDIILQKQDITNGQVLKHDEFIVRQEYKNNSLCSRLKILERIGL